MRPALRRRLLDTAAVVLRLDTLMAQGFRFALTGVVVSIVYIGTTTAFALTTNWPFQVGLTIGWLTSLTIHFTLQRKFVWAHDDGFALPFRHQISRYLVVAGTQFGVIALSTTVLPPLLGLSAEVVYLGVATLVTLTNFLVFRHGVFHARPSETVRSFEAPFEAPVPVLPQVKPA